tara:strand:+ start:984 stop:1121 length:138 start_codon:yes stop_codon:yes gene_type:complete
VPPYMKGIGESLTMNLDKDKFCSSEMTVDFMVSHFLKDFESYPKL